MRLTFSINKLAALASVTSGLQVALQSGTYWAATVFDDFRGDNA